MSYFNTTNESGKTLKNNVAKAKSQEQEIFDFFILDNKQYKKTSLHMFVGLTPSNLFSLLLKNYPITSIRRALTNLTKQGKLIKTNEKRIGMYGRSEYVWKLNENN